MKRLFIFIAALIAATVAFGQTPLPNDPAVRTGQLENGLKYYIRHNDQPAQRAEFWIATDAGANQEEDHQDGLAHFFEHMCFNGTKNFPGKSMLTYLQSIGAEFGRNINASTGFEVTQYMLNNIPVVRESIVDSCLLVLHDWSGFVTCDPAEIDNERGVIIEEKRGRDAADWRMYMAARPYIYGDVPYGRRTLIGGYDQLANFEHQSLTEFHQKWYRPDNQAIIVVGDIDVDAIEAKIKTMFSDIPVPAEPVQKPVYKLADNVEPIVGIITDPEAQYSYVEILWKREPMPKEFNNTDVAFMTNIVKSYVRQIMGERLADIAADPTSPFIQAGVYFYPICNECDATRAQVLFREGNMAPALKTFMLEVEKMKQFGFTEAEVQRATENILKAYEKAVEAAGSRKNGDFVDPLLNNFYQNESYLEPELAYQLAQGLCGQINAQILNQLLGQFQFVTDENMIVLYNGPSKEGSIIPTEDEIRNVLAEVKTIEVQPNAEEAVNEPFISEELKGSPVKTAAETVYGATEWTLKNGVKVIVLPTELKKDQVIFNITKKGGKTLIATEDLPSFEDNIWSLYLEYAGISKFAGKNIPKMLAGKSLSVSPYIGGSRHGVNGSSTPKDLETALQIAYLYFTAPRFDESEYMTGINQINALMPNMKANPDFLFDIEMDKILYGNNPRVVSLTDETLEKADLATIERVYRELFKDAAGAVVTIVGNVDLETLKPMVEKYIGSLPKGKKATDVVEENLITFAKGVVNEEVRLPMQAPKSTVVQLYTAYAPVNTKKSVALDAANYIIDMIYTKTIREDEGGTYGVGTSMLAQKLPMERLIAQVYFNTNPESVEKLSALATKGLKELAENGPTAEHFNMAMENFKKNLPESRINNSYWLNCLNTWVEQGINYDAEYEEAINTLTAEDVKAALQELLSQGNVINIASFPAE
ncbi:MAG: insulinase family protein [Bacteroidales bacterium]|nr:insulinase family protein [Bacteroidales bacterium]